MIDERYVVPMPKQMLSIDEAFGRSAFGMSGSSLVSIVSLVIPTPLISSRRALGGPPATSTVAALSSKCAFGAAVDASRRWMYVSLATGTKSSSTRTAVRATARHARNGRRLDANAIARQLPIAASTMHRAMIDALAPRAGISRKPAATVPTTHPAVLAA